MSWRDRFQKGSFRGVSFEVKESTLNAGRRIAVHEYPQRDFADVEDLGLDPRSYQLELYVVGPDYMTRRDALLGALEAPGSGTLVHPYLGTLSVFVERITLKETTAAGGMAAFSVTFRASAAPQFPQQSTDTAAKLQAAAEKTTEQARESFAKSFVPEEDFLDDTSRRLAAFFTTANLACDVQLGAHPDEITEALLELIRTSRSLLSLVGLVEQVIGKPAPKTAGRIAQIDDLVRLETFVRLAAGAEACHRSAQEAFASSFDALRRQHELVSVIDTLLEETSGFRLILEDLRVAVLADMTERGAKLPRLDTCTLAATLPALVVAHRLYGDPLRATEIVARNAIPHPGFVPGGEPLEVLDA